MARGLTLASVLLLLTLGCRTPILPDTGTPWPGSQSEQVGSPDWLSLSINEFMADNRSTLVDGTGCYGDWIELFNPSTERVELDGFTITDDEDEPDKHVLEQIGIDAGRYLLLWADGQPSKGPDHLGFSLDAEQGEDLALYVGGTLVSGLSFGRQAADHALARELDGGDSWMITAEHTAGWSNSGGTRGSVDSTAWPWPPSSCELISDLEDPWLSEGDQVDLSLSCGGDMPTELAELEPVSMPRGASYADGRFSWQTDGSSAARVELVFALTTAGSQGEVPTAETITFWVADDPDAENSQPVDPATYTEEWGLPVLHVSTWSEISSGYVAAEVNLDGRYYAGSIKVRGATSSSFPKPGYTLEFTEEELELAQWDVTRDHLVLLSPFDDNAYVRQKLIYDQWAAIAEFWGEERLTPRTFFVVVYLNDEYLGLFMGLDRIDNQFIEHQGFEPASNLYKAVDHDANFYLTDSYGEKKESLHEGYEKKEGDPDDDFGDLDALVSFTGNADAQALIDGAGDWLDLQEFMDWFLLVHYSHSGDSGGKNSYLANAPGAYSFRYVPWDFNHSWGQSWRTYRLDSSDMSHFTSANKVFWAIQELDSADAELWERYRQMAQPGGPYDPDWLAAQLDAYYAEIDIAAQKDWAKWGQDYLSYELWQEGRDEEGDWTDYQGEKEYLYQWLDERAELFAEQR